MPYSSKRIQVLLPPKVRDILEAFAEDDGLTNSKACAVLIEEALKARGLMPDPAAHLSPDIHHAVQREAKASENGWTPDMGADAMDDFLPTGWKRQTVMRKAEPLPTEDAQTLKLKLMQELMDQLKSM